MNAPVSLYAESLRRHADGASFTTSVRFRDGPVRSMEVDRWIAVADAVDEDALALLDGPVLDVGCGPGRHLHALARRGVFGLGVDLCPAAVELARGRGAHAIVGSIFEAVPRTGQWRSALLLDGNIGIGGRPGRLLQRLGEVLAPEGTVLVELADPRSATVETMARIETPSRVSDWFRWAEVSTASIAEVAAPAGFAVDRVWRNAHRWFALLVVSGPRH